MRFNGIRILQIIRRFVFHQNITVSTLVKMTTGYGRSFLFLRYIGKYIGSLVRIPKRQGFYLN